MPPNPRRESVNGDRQNGYHMKGYYRTISGFAEAIRTLRNTILLRDMETPIRSLLITSASPGDGKTTAAVHLAVAHAEQGRKTLLVDGDMRRPSIHRKFGLAGSTGLTNVLIGELEWKEAVVHIEHKPNLDILPAGPPSHRASDLIGPRMGELLDEFAKDYELVMGSLEPLAAMHCPTEFSRLSPWSSTVVFVVMSVSTYRPPCFSSLPLTLVAPSEPTVCCSKSREEPGETLAIIRPLALCTSAWPVTAETCSLLALARNTRIVEDGPTGMTLSEFTRMG